MMFFLIIIILYILHMCAVALLLFGQRVKFSPIINHFQELKIEGEQPEMMEEDNLDLMLPTKKKKSKKVDIDECDALDKDDGKNL